MTGARFPTLLGRAASFAGLTLLARCTGVARDIAMAAAFGAGAGSDAFVLAFRIPNSLRRLFADGALSAAFVPALVREAEHADHARMRGLIAQMAGTLGLLVAIVTAASVLCARPLAMAFAPGAAADARQLALLASLLQITFPFLLCVSLAALAGAVLMSHGRYSRWALAPALLNLCMVVGAVWLAPRLAVPIQAMAWAVLAGGVLQMVWLWSGVARLDLLSWPRWGGADPRVRVVARAMLPTVAGASVAQLNLIFASAVASLLYTGSQTWLFQADRFLELPLALFGASMGVVLLPTLSRAAVQGSAQAGQTLAWALRWVFLATLPATVGLILLAGPLMVTFFQYGRYGALDSAMSARALALMSLGLPALAVIKILLPAYYARGDLSFPVRAAAVSLLCNVGCCALLLAAVAGWPGTTADAAGWSARLAAQPGLHALLALASAVANICNAALLWRGLRRAGVLAAQVHAPWQLLRILAACAVMAGMLLLLRERLNFGAMGAAMRLASLFALIAAGMAGFAGSWHLAGGRLASLRAAAD